MAGYNISLDEITESTLTGRCYEWARFPVPGELFEFETTGGDFFYGRLASVKPASPQQDMLDVRYTLLSGRPDIKIHQVSLISASTYLSRQHQASSGIPFKAFGATLDLHDSAQHVWVRPDEAGIHRELVKALVEAKRPLLIIDPVGLDWSGISLKELPLGSPTLRLSIQDVGISWFIDALVQDLPHAAQLAATEALMAMSPATPSFIPLTYFAEHPDLTSQPMMSVVLHRLYQWHQRGLFAVRDDQVLIPEKLHQSSVIHLAGLPNDMLQVAYDGLLNWAYRQSLDADLQLVLVAPELVEGAALALLPRFKQRVWMVSRQETPWQSWAQECWSCQSIRGVSGLCVEGPVSHGLSLFLPLAEPSVHFQEPQRVPSTGLDDPMAVAETLIPEETAPVFVESLEAEVRPLEPASTPHVIEEVFDEVEMPLVIEEIPEMMLAPLSVEDNEGETISESSASIEIPPAPEHDALAQADISLPLLDELPDDALMGESSAVVPPVDAFWDVADESIDIPEEVKAQFAPLEEEMTAPVAPEPFEDIPAPGLAMVHKTLEDEDNEDDVFSVMAPVSSDDDLSSPAMGLDWDSVVEEEPLGLPSLNLDMDFDSLDVAEEDKLLPLEVEDEEPELTDLEPLAANALPQVEALPLSPGPEVISEEPFETWDALELDELSSSPLSMSSVEALPEQNLVAPSTAPEPFDDELNEWVILSESSTESLSPVSSSLESVTKSDTISALPDDLLDPLDREALSMAGFDLSGSEEEEYFQELPILEQLPTLEVPDASGDSTPVDASRWQDSGDDDIDATLMALMDGFDDEPAPSQSQPTLSDIEGQGFASPNELAMAGDDEALAFLEVVDLGESHQVDTGLPPVMSRDVEDNPEIALFEDLPTMPQPITREMSTEGELEGLSLDEGELSLDWDLSASGEEDLPVMPVVPLAEETLPSFSPEPEALSQAVGLEADDFDFGLPVIAPDEESSLASELPTAPLPPQPSADEDEFAVFPVIPDDSDVLGVPAINEDGQLIQPETPSLLPVFEVNLDEANEEPSATSIKPALSELSIDFDEINLDLDFDLEHSAQESEHPLEVDEIEAEMEAAIAEQLALSVEAIAVSDAEPSSVAPLTDDEFDLDFELDFDSPAPVVSASASDFSYTPPTPEPETPADMTPAENAWALEAAEAEIALDLDFNLDDSPEFDLNTSPESEPAVVSSAESSIAVYPNATTSEDEGYRVGQQVNHPKYGKGLIKRVIQMDEGQLILNIQFEQVGKRLLDPKLSPLEKVS